MGGTLVRVSRSHCLIRLFSLILHSIVLRRNPSGSTVRTLYLIIFPLFPGAWFSSPLSSWRYSDSYSADWHSPSFEDAHWNSATAGYFPSIPSSVITRYYRHTLSSSLTREEINQFVGFRLSGATQTGFICYINGVEIFRKNLPSWVFPPSHTIVLLSCRGTIHDYIPATVSFPSPLTYSYVVI